MQSDESYSLLNVLSTFSTRCWMIECSE